MLRVLLSNSEHTSHRKNDCDYAAICWGYRTLTEVPDTRDRILVPLVLHTGINKTCNDLTLQCNRCYLYKCDMAIQKVKDQDIKNYNIAGCSVWV